MYPPLVEQTSEITEKFGQSNYKINLKIGIYKIPLVLLHSEKDVILKLIVPV